MGLESELTLPCGATLGNRLCKAAMTEGLADARARATSGHVNLYSAWAQSGAGLLLTGNVQVDRRYLERSGNVCVDGEQSEKAMARLRAFAEAGKSCGGHVWVQLSHGGRQSTPLVAPIVQAPSSVSSNTVMPPAAEAREMTGEEVEAVVERFAHGARVVKEAGFTGVQLHSAHGYLLSSFLNPLANRRTDRYGGPLENRARLLLDIVAAVREAVGPEFPVAVKLNSSDFQQGGLTCEEAAEVARMLDEAGVDLIEVSGGNYEAPALLDRSVLAESTKRREAYFLEYAADIRKAVKRAALMVTGGFRSRQAMEEALSEGSLDIIGLGRPFCVDARCTRPLLDGTIDVLPSPEDTLKTPPTLAWISRTFPSLKALGKMGSVQMVLYDNLYRLGRSPDAKMNDGKAIVGTVLRMQAEELRAALSLEGVPKLPSQDRAKLREQRKRRMTAALIFVLALVLVRLMTR